MCKYSQAPSNYTFKTPSKMEEASFTKHDCKYLAWLITHKNIKCVGLLVT